ncbi:hypothetical protein ACWEN3_14440, partial [Streptomyces sp. NPDC004561]
GCRGGPYQGAQQKGRPQPRRQVLVAVAHVLVPQGQRAASAFVAADAVEEPQAGGEVLQGAAQQCPRAGGGDLVD